MIERALDLVVVGERLASGTAPARGRLERRGRRDGLVAQRTSVPKNVVDTNLYVEADGPGAGGVSAAVRAPSVPTSRRSPGDSRRRRDDADYREYHEDWVAPFEDLGRVITPGHTAWTRAALIVARLVERGYLSAGGFSRSFLNGCLIAASARDQKFVLVTRNSGDFALISRVEGGLRYQPPWPES